MVCPALCVCGHVHETVMCDGNVSVFHRCRADGCVCNEFLYYGELNPMEQEFPPNVPESIKPHAADYKPAAWRGRRESRRDG